MRDGGPGEGAPEQRDGRETEPGATIALEKAAAPAKGAPRADGRGAGAGVVVKQLLPPAALAPSGASPVCGAGGVSSCSADCFHGSSGAGMAGNAGTSARHGAAVGDVCGGAGDTPGGLPGKSHSTRGVPDGGAVGWGGAQGTAPGSGGGDNGGEGFVSTWGCSNGSGGAVLQDGGGVWEGPFPWSDKMQEVLRRTFNLSRFRPLQSPVINCFLSRKDAFVLLPTGGGKSLCYQVAHAPSPCPLSSSRLPLPCVLY